MTIKSFENIHERTSQATSDTEGTTKETRAASSPAKTILELHIQLFVSEATMKSTSAFYNTRNIYLRSTTKEIVDAPCPLFQDTEIAERG